MKKTLITSAVAIVLIMNGCSMNDQENTNNYSKKNTTPVVNKTVNANVQAPGRGSINSISGTDSDADDVVNRNATLDMDSASSFGSGQ